MCRGCLRFEGNTAIAPDGSRIVYVAKAGETTRLYVRETNRFEIAALPGTEGAQYPFFSPDGKWIGYWDVLYKLKKVSVGGGAPVFICDTGMQSRGASWGANEIIVFNRSFDSGLSAVPADGGTPRIVTEVDRARGEKTHRFPHVLPDGEHVLFVIGTSTISSYDEATIAVVSLRTGEQKFLIEGGSCPRYAPTGHLVYARDGGLMAVPFDPARLEVTGAPTQVFDGLVMSHTWGAAQFSFSDEGSLVYVPGGPEVYINRLVWVDREGDTAPVSLGDRSPMWVRLSPRGDRAVLHVVGGNDELWLDDLRRETLTRLTAGWDNQWPLWTPEGHRVIFGSNRNGLWEVFGKSADSREAAEKIRGGERAVLPASISPDGTLLVYTEDHPDTKSDIWCVSLEDDKGARPLVVTEFDEWGGELSPDGRWLAYCSNESGRYEIYIRALAGGLERWQISTDGGTEPAWAPNGRELYYRSGNRMMVVAVELSPEIKIAKPVVLFEAFPPSLAWPMRKYDIAADGRFLMIEPSEQLNPTRIHNILNWFEQLKQLAPTE